MAIVGNRAAVVASAIFGNSEDTAGDPPRNSALIFRSAAERTVCSKLPARASRMLISMPSAFAARSTAIRCALLWLRRSASESGRLRQPTEGHSRGDRRRSVLMLPTLRGYDEALVGHHVVSPLMGHTYCSITCVMISTCPSRRRPDLSATRSDRTLSGWMTDTIRGQSRFARA